PGGRKIGERRARRAACRAPDFGKMALAASRRTNQHEAPRRPVRPAVDPGNGVAVALGDQKIITSKRDARGKIKRDLKRRHLFLDRLLGLLGRRAAEIGRASCRKACNARGAANREQATTTADRSM